MYVDGHALYLNSIIYIVLCIKYYDSFPPTISILTKHTCFRVFFHQKEVMVSAIHDYPRMLQNNPAKIIQILPPTI